MLEQQEDYNNCVLCDWFSRALRLDCADCRMNLEREGVVARDPSASFSESEERLRRVLRVSPITDATISKVTLRIPE